MSPSAKALPTQSAQRIVSLLPSATEICCFVGAADRLVAVTHECDFPLGIGAAHPHVTASLLAPNLTAAEIDAAVTQVMKADAHSIYALDTTALHALHPDAIITQSLCDVCAVPERTVKEFACTLPKNCSVVTADPSTLSDLFGCIQVVGDAIGADGTSKAVDCLRKRYDALRAATVAIPAEVRRPRVLVLEWPAPPYAPGHWVAEQVEAAGGVCAIGKAGEKSVRVEWSTLLALEIDVVVCAFCGFNLIQNQERLEEIAGEPEWETLKSRTRVFASDASAYFSRPGPRLIDGAEKLAYALHGAEALAGVVEKPRSGEFSELENGKWIDLST
jgi:iron complex transport system substrate-binding protein